MVPPPAPAREVALAELQAEERAIASRLLAAIDGAEVADGFDIGEHVAAIARTLALVKRRSS